MIKHILKDGREVADMKSHRVTINDQTKTAYEILKNKNSKGVK